jgi:hypothetical protein
MPARAPKVAPSLKLGLRVHSSKERRLGRFYIRRPTGRTLSNTKAQSALSDPAIESFAPLEADRPSRKEVSLTTEHTPKYKASHSKPERTPPGNWFGPIAD